MQLADLKGERILICLLHQHLIEEKDKVLTARLVEIESAGIWIEGTALAEFLQATYRKPISRTPIYFVPFAQVSWILSNAEYPYLSEISLGLKIPEPKAEDDQKKG